MHKIIFISDNERLEITHESLRKPQRLYRLPDPDPRICVFASPGIYKVEEILGLERLEEVAEEEVS